MQRAWPVALPAPSLLRVWPIFSSGDEPHSASWERGNLVEGATKQVKKILRVDDDPDVRQVDAHVSGANYYDTFLPPTG